MILQWGALKAMLDIATAIGDRAGIAFGSGMLGEINKNLGEHDTALEFYHRQHEVAAEIGDRMQVVQATGGIGSVFAACGQYEQALEQLMPVLNESRSIIGNPLVIATLLMDVATVLLALARSLEVMPQYLPQYLPELSDAAWDSSARQTAREYLDESLSFVGHQPDLLAKANAIWEGAKGEGQRAKGEGRGRSPGAAAV